MKTKINQHQINIFAAQFCCSFSCASISFCQHSIDQKQIYYQQLLFLSSQKYVSSVSLYTFYLPKHFFPQHFIAFPDFSSNSKKLIKHLQNIKLTIDTRQIDSKRKVYNRGDGFLIYPVVPLIVRITKFIIGIASILQPKSYDSLNNSLLFLNTRWKISTNTGIIRAIGTQKSPRITAWTTSLYLSPGTFWNTHELQNPRSQKGIPIQLIRIDNNTIPKVIPFIFSYNHPLPPSSIVLYTITTKSSIRRKEDQVKQILTVIAPQIKGLTTLHQIMYALLNIVSLVSRSRAEMSRQQA